MAQRRKSPFSVSQREQQDAEDDKSFMHAQREIDAEDTKQGVAAKLIKATHGLAQELEKRLRTARMATSTPEAIRHDLERVIELAADVTESAQESLKALGR